MGPAPAAARGVPLPLNVQTLSLEGLSKAPATRVGAASGGGRAGAAPTGGSGARRLPRGSPSASSAGRPAAACQVEVEVLEALALPPAAVATQTDPAPAAPAVLVEAPSGADAATQVTPDELFDWQRDAAPAVAMLVSQALAAAALEAGEALRLEALQRRRRELEEEQYREAAALLRLEEDARRRAAERAQRLREAEARAASPPPEAFRLMGEDELAELALAPVLSALETLCAATLKAGCSGDGAVGGGHVAHGERLEAEAASQAEAQQQKRVVLAVDASEDSIAAFTWVLQNLLRPEDELHLLHVVPDVFTSPASGSVYYCSSPDPETERLLWNNAKQFFLDNFVEPAKERGLEDAVTLHLVKESRHHHIGKAVCKKADELAAAPLVLAAHDRGPLEKLLLGSVSDYCVTHSKRPVLLLHREHSALQQHSAA
ncbi:adenine nucleotide alpha hydrolase [Micractinium conductrix]|uniref:Adenine nucleotide alpha hydrolase n=1 Tax=Micractinium conductrix TaxID=554055 RepID=A0A2P6VLY0_9CHLO|nr:adenine nucleotide alpha hydrolase [Micractinium conductrix]|eukprot:PSC75094.1 adenine nucleotide alpha hydrolase [Micractinium conductrix]